MPNKFSKRLLLFRALLFVVIALTVTDSLLACPNETVRYPPFTLRQLKGRVLPPYGEQELGQLAVKFTVREKRRDRAGVRHDVPVKEDGSFALALPEGSYEFSITVDGFLFTLIGEINISRKASRRKSMNLQPPWC